MRRALKWSAAGRVLAVILVILAGQRALPSLRHDLARFRLARAGDTRVAGVIPKGRVVLTELVPPRRLAVGDVVAYDHPLREPNTVYGTVTHLEPLPGTSGYIVRLDVGEPSGEPWYAEFIGGVRRVVLHIPVPAAFGARWPPGGAAGVLPLALIVGAALGALLVWIVWYRARSSVVRSSR